MAERKYNKHDVSSSHCNTRRNLRHIVPNYPSESSSQRKQPEESIVQHSVSLVNQNNFMVGLPSWQYRQPYHYNLVYGNINQSVSQPHLYQTYFHRLNQESQRTVQTTSNNIGDTFINNLRFWEQTAPEKSGSGFIFSVMCYNVLAQDLLNNHPYLYKLHEKETLNWNIRWNNLYAEIRRLDPDILCLQEVQNSHMETHFSKLENLGYKGLYKKRTGAQTDGCAIYYKDKFFNLVENTTIEYNQPNIRILDRDNIAIIAKFSHKKHPKKEFVVATTHLLYNPKRQDVRLAQTQLLLTEIDRIAFTQGQQYLPIIVTGDLNSTPDSAIYKFITNGKLKYENLLSRSLKTGNGGPKTGKNFLPSSLRITDECKHADLIPKRQNNVRISRSEELDLIKLKHSERPSYEAKNGGSPATNDKGLFASGTLNHNLHLNSVYLHHSQGAVEGTTFQDEWITVDYIFYSKRSKQGGLTLLQRYRLPTKTELGNTKIPNSNLGSDHLSLLAKFQLHV